MVLSSKQFVDLILGNKKISHKEITAEGWLEIIKEDSGFLSAYRKYLSGFTPISKLLNCAIRERHKRQTCELIVKFPEGISQETRCKEVATLEKKEREKLTWKSKDWGPRFVRKRILLLHQNKPRWLIWEFEYERVVGPDSERIYSTHQAIQVKCLFKVCHFYFIDEIDENELLEELSGNAYLGVQILIAFKSILKETIEKKEKRIKKIKMKEKLIGEQLSLIG